jgi:hypothetical protein
MHLYSEVNILTHGYVRKGGKDNRNQQRRRMLAFAKLAQKLGAKSLAQVGRRHVVLYWKRHQHLSDATLMAHWYAIRELWRMAGKLEDPPKPFAERERMAKEQARLIAIMLE